MLDFFSLLMALLHRLLPHLQARHMNECDGFMQECLIKYDIDIFDLFCEVFTHLPLASIVHLKKSKVMVVHGGISAKVCLVGCLY